LKQVFDKLQQAESAGLSAEQMRKLEEQAAEQGMRTLWKVSGIEFCGCVLAPRSDTFNPHLIVSPSLYQCLT
jgi:hypothetical protein